MESLFASGRIVDFAIAILVIEAVALHVRGRGHTAAGIAANVAAGLFLLLALRFALTDAGWITVAICLAAGGMAHAADVFLRLSSLRQNAGSNS